MTGAESAAKTLGTPTAQAIMAAIFMETPKHARSSSSRASAHLSISHDLNDIAGV